MAAKRKLNAAHFLGCTMASGLLGLVTASFEVFLIALAASLAASYHAGNIRR